MDALFLRCCALDSGLCARDPASCAVLAQSATTRVCPVLKTSLYVRFKGSEHKADSAEGSKILRRKRTAAQNCKEHCVALCAAEARSKGSGPKYAASLSLAPSQRLPSHMELDNGSRAALLDIKSLEKRKLLLHMAVSVFCSSRWHAQR